MHNLQTEKQNTPMLSIGKASEYLGVSIDTLRRWGKKGRINAHRSPGNHRYFYKKDLDELFGTRYERVGPTKSHKKKEVSKIEDENKEEKEKKASEDSKGLEPKVKKEEIIDWSYKYENKKQKVVNIPKNEPIRIISTPNEQQFPEITHYNPNIQDSIQLTSPPPTHTSLEFPYNGQSIPNLSNYKQADQTVERKTSILEAPTQTEKVPQATEGSRKFLTTNQVIVLTIITFTIATVMLMLVFLNPEAEILSPIP